MSGKDLCVRRQQEEPSQRVNKRRHVSARQVRSSEAAVEESVTAEKCLLFLPIETDASRCVTGCMQDNSTQERRIIVKRFKRERLCGSADAEEVILHLHRRSHRDIRFMHPHRQTETATRPRRTPKMIQMPVCGDDGTYMEMAPLKVSLQFLLFRDCLAGRVNQERLARRTADNIHIRAERADLKPFYFQHC